MIDISDDFIRYFASAIQEATGEKFYFLKFGKSLLSKSNRAIIYYVAIDGTKMVLILENDKLKNYVSYDKSKRSPVEIDISNHESIINSIKLAYSPIPGHVYDE